MSKLTDNHFSFNCPMDFSAMTPSANGVFCGKCKKEVFDLTDCSIDDVIALQRKHGTICGMIRLMPLAATAVSLSAAACCPQPSQGNHDDAKATISREYGGGEVIQSYELLKSK